jgi:hypothetical protein
MNKKILFLSLLAIIFILPVMALAQTMGVPPIITKIREMFISIGGSIVVIGWIIAGILYLTSAGSPEKTGTAKKAMIAAVIGTTLIVLSVFAEEIISFYLH